MLFGSTLCNIFIFKMLFANCFVILFALSYASSPQPEPLTGSERSTNRNESSNDDIWALLVAGSMGWINYRHQADVCHAYQVLRAHGVSDDHIVVMMVDDIAHNENNPTPGVIINKPGGDNVYTNVPRDYTGQDVTVANFINILQGNKAAMDGIGSGKVIESGPDSYLFINLVDHGSPGIFTFPEEYLHAQQLNKVIQAMHDSRKYREMLIYVEACESGSLFDGLLPSNINVYATTAANPNEVSYGCYYDSVLETYLGDVYSVKWMQNIDKNGTLETLRKQYELVKQETNTSHVMRYGDLFMGWDRVSRFMGSKQVPSLVGGKEHDKPCEDGVPSGDVPIAILANRIRAETDDAKKAVLEQQLLEELQLRENVRSTVHKIATKVATTEGQLTELLQTKSLPRNFDCIDYSVQLFTRRCYNINKVEYAMRQLYILVNLCEMQDMDLNLIEDAITSTCN